MAAVAAAGLVGAGMPLGAGSGTTGVGTEWLWEALVSCRHAHSVVTQLAPADFDWNGVHPVHGTPLMAAVNEIVRSGQVNREVRPVLQWCLRQGADPRRTAVTARGYSGGWGNGTEEFPHVPRVPHAGRCAITLVLGLIGVLERISVYEHKGKYQDQLLAAKQLLSIFAQFRAGVPRRPVAEAAVEMWANIQMDCEHADVELHATGDDSDDFLCFGSRQQGAVRAHSLVLCHASPVLRASLTLGMREGQTRVLEVPGASLASVELLLAILYSGTLPAQAASPAKQARGDWAIGDAVEANWRGLGRWWAGRIATTDDEGGGFCGVIYDGEGAFSEKRVPPSCLRPPLKAAAGGGVAAGRAAGHHGAAGGVGSAVEQAKVQLMALDIAHRWQVGHAVSLLEHALAQHMREGSQTGWFASARDHAEHVRAFEELLEAAALKDLPLLRAACRQFACETPEVRRHYERGGFGTLVARELQQLCD